MRATYLVPLVAIAAVTGATQASAQAMVREQKVISTAGARAIPPRGRPRLAQAAERVVRLYDAWGKPDQAAAWRAKLAEVQSELPADVFAPP